MDYLPAACYDMLREAGLGGSERLREQVDACLARGDVAWESHVAESIWLTSPESAVMHAHYADLVVLRRVANATVDSERARFSSLLLDTGQALLVVPRGAGCPSNLGKLVGACRPSPEPRRARTHALPMHAPPAPRHQGHD